MKRSYTQMSGRGRERGRRVVKPCCVLHALCAEERIARTRYEPVRLPL